MYDCFMNIGITGHRQITHDKEKIKRVLKEIVLTNNCKRIISGMALGFDTIAAEVALELQIPLVAALPFVEQAALWPEEDKEKYLSILEKTERIYIQPENPNGNKFNAGYFGRNRWIVSQSEMLVAYMINDVDGGTAHAWKEAGKKKIPRINVVDLL